MRNITFFILGIILVGGINLSNGQDLSLLENNDQSKALRVLVVLKAGEKSAEIDNRLGDRFNFDDIEVSSIRSIEVLKGGQGNDLYGEQASDGVIVINFKDFALLDNKTKKLFEKKTER